MAKRYWQIPLEASSQEITFATLWELYKFVRMPFGLHGVVVTFQCLTDKVLAWHQGCNIVYIDNMVVYSETWEEHLQYLTAVLEELRAESLTQRNAHWGRGYPIFRLPNKGEKIQLVRDKAQAIRDYNLPPTKRQIWSSLGQCYYCHLVPQFLDRTAPLSKLIKDLVLNWIIWIAEAK